MALLDELVAEAREGVLRTVVLFPTLNAVPVEEMYRSMSRKLNQQRQRGQTGELKLRSENPLFRLVTLESSYSKAHRMFKLLVNGMQRHGFTLPVAKLAVRDGQILRSAFHGIMRQPAPDKISTFQAVVMALRQISGAMEVSQRGRLSALCDCLDDDLTSWLGHLLRKGVKKGKFADNRSQKWQHGLEMQEEFKDALNESAHAGPRGAPVFRVYERMSSMMEVKDLEEQPYPQSIRAKNRLLRKAVQVALREDGSLTTLALRREGEGHESEDYFLTLRKSKRFRVLGLVRVADVVVEKDVYATVEGQNQNRSTNGIPS